LSPADVVIAGAGFFLLQAGRAPPLLIMPLMIATSLVMHFATN
jgi:hypothetical protein